MKLKVFFKGNDARGKNYKLEKNPSIKQGAFKNQLLL